MWTQRNVPTVGLAPRKSKSLSLSPPFLLPPFPSSFLPLPSQFQHLIEPVHTHYFICPLIRSYTREGKVTNSILQMNKTKQSSGSRAKTGSFPMIQCYVPFLSAPFSIQHPSHPASCLAFDFQDSLFR